MFVDILLGILKNYPPIVCIEIGKLMFISFKKNNEEIFKTEKNMLESFFW
jgi:hypothetical protein